MFTGIITDIGTVIDIVGEDYRQITIETGLDLSVLPIGESIACSGACMTMTQKKGKTFKIDVSPESLEKTTLKNWSIGQSINLEASLKAGDSIGGHHVTGHVDGIATIEKMTAIENSWFFEMQFPQEFIKFLAPKGSVAIDGVSLTINKVIANRVHLCIIPHTMEKTIFHNYSVGGDVNFEIDSMARYIGHYLSHMHSIA